MLKYLFDVGEGLTAGEELVCDEGQYRIKRLKRPIVEMKGKAIETLAAPITSFVYGELAGICEKLNLPRFVPVNTEVKLLACNNGASMKRHVDSGTRRNSQGERRLTWLYYLHDEPRQFAGGNLIFHLPSGAIHEVAPTAGRLVVFSSAQPHEVSPVVITSNVARSSRLVLTGFVMGRRSFGRELSQWVKDRLSAVFSPHKE